MGHDPPEKIGPTGCQLCQACPARLWVSTTPAVAWGQASACTEIWAIKKSTKRAPTPDAKNISRRHEAAD